MDRTGNFGIVLSLFLLVSTALSAQTAADRELIKRARSLYYTPISRPAYIACDSAIDWDAVAKQANLPKLDGYILGLKLAKATKVDFVTRGGKRTEVNVVGDPGIAEQKERMRNLITAFFQKYWATADGQMLPPSRINFELASTPEGYLMTRQENGLVASVQMDSLFLITKARAHNIETTEDVEITPNFVKENDGLLHLHGLPIDDKMGELQRLVEYTFDYQQVGGFYVPHHVMMSMPGVVSYPHTFSNCQVFDKSNAPPQPTPAAAAPR